MNNTIINNFPPSSSIRQLLQLQGTRCIALHFLCQIAHSLLLYGIYVFPLLPPPPQNTVSSQDTWIHPLTQHFTVACCGRRKRSIFQSIIIPILRSTMFVGIYETRYDLLPLSARESLQDIAQVSCSNHTSFIHLARLKICDAFLLPLFERKE